MPHTAVGDVEIYWESHGRGKPLLLISGVSGGTWTWEESIGAWSPHCRVIVFDNMGAGRSSMPDRPYGIAEMADHAAAVLDAAAEERAFVVGLSMGGMIAQELALCHPERISALVLGCTHCGGRERIPPVPEVIQKFATNAGLSPEEIIDKNLNLLVTPAFLRSGYALQRQLEAIRSFNACARLGSLQAPTLILTADCDQLVPAENGRLLAKRITGAELKSFTDTGHLIYLERAQTFHQTVMGFFRGLS
jgi:3-oxoadipate enol-lactonase